MSSTTYQDRCLLELKKLLYSEIDRIKDELTTVHFSPGFDFSSYKYMVGKIEGIRSAIQLCDDAEAITNGKER